MLRATLAALATAGAIVAGCGKDGGSQSAAGPSVVATTTQAADFARNVAGERAQVSGILDANSDPHDYEPRPSDVAAVAEADLILSSGGDLDLWLGEVVESSGSDAPVITLIGSAETIEGDGGEADPHWWQNPANAVLAVKAIRDELIVADPQGRAEYERNATDYVAAIERLDSQIAECISEVPVDERKLVTSHDALGYFADRYGIEVVGSTIPALTTQAQPSTGETAELVELIRSEGVNAVFPEVGVSGALEQAVAEETEAEVGHELYADALGPEGSFAATYLEAMAANAEALVSGFSGGEAVCEISVDG